MSTAITIDYSRFNDALALYKLASGKTLTDSVNHACGNMAFRAAQFGKEHIAQKSEIRALWSSRPWWNKYISRVLKEAGWTISGRRKATEAEKAAAYLDAASGKWKTGRKTVGTRRSVGLGAKVSRADRLRVSRGIIARRIRSVKYFVSRFAWVAAAFKPNAVGRIGGKNIWRIATQRAQERQPNPLAEFVIPIYVERKNLPTSDQSSALGKEAIGGGLLQRAVEFVADDLLQYAIPRLQKHGVRFSRG